MINAIAVDDEPPALSIIENFCQRIDFIKLQKTFTGPNEALKYLRKFPVSLMFLDIQMPSLTGIEMYKSVQQDTMVIFTTAFSDYAVEGFNLNAIDYLLKPFTFERFLKAANKAKDFYSYSRPVSQEQQYILIRADYSLVKVNLADIICIEGLDDYLKIYIMNQKTLVARMTMKSMAEKLPDRDFVRVHRSFIVPLKRISSVRNKTIYVDDKEIPIGSSYEEAFLKLFHP
jgi:DNA-binding LytR/AlgR family response regulator